MAIFYKVSILILLTLILYMLYRHILVKIQISTGKTKRIILKKNKKTDYYYIILGLIDIALSFIGQLINGNFEITIFWFLLGLVFILKTRNFCF